MNDTVRVCPERDAICPHGMMCPYWRSCCTPDSPTDAQNLNRLSSARSAPRLIAEAQRRFHATQDRFYRDVAERLQGAVPMTARRLTHRQRSLARHALGLPNDRNVSYRNRFLCPYAPGSYDQWSAMVDAGLASCGPVLNGERSFWLTHEGAELALDPGETLCPEDFPT